MLDLRCQRQRDRALSPLEEIGVPAVRNNDVRKEMRRPSDVGDGLLDGEVVQPQLEDTDRFAPARHRREQAGAVALIDHLDGLSGQRPAVRRPDQRHPFRSLLSMHAPLPARVA